MSESSDGELSNFKLYKMKSGYIILIGLMFVIIGLTRQSLIVTAIMCGIGGVLIGNGIGRLLK